MYIILYAVYQNCVNKRKKNLNGKKKKHKILGQSYPGVTFYYNRISVSTDG